MVFQRGGVGDTGKLEPRLEARCGCRSDRRRSASRSARRAERAPRIGATPRGAIVQIEFVDETVRIARRAAGRAERRWRRDGPSWRRGFGDQLGHELLELSLLFPGARGCSRIAGSPAGSGSSERGKLQARRQILAAHRPGLTEPAAIEQLHPISATFFREAGELRAALPAESRARRRCSRQESPEQDESRASASAAERAPRSLKNQRGNRGELEQSAETDERSRTPREAAREPGRDEIADRWRLVKRCPAFARKMREEQEPDQPAYG